MLWGNKAHAPQQKTSPQWEVHVPPLENRPCSLQIEKAHAQQQKRSTAKIKINKNFKNKVVPVGEIVVTEEEEEEEEMGQFHWILSMQQFSCFPSENNHFVFNL